MAKQLYNLAEKGIGDVDSVHSCFKTKHKELLSLVEGVKDAMRRDVLTTYENNNLLIDGNDCAGKSVQSISDNSVTAISSFMHFASTSFARDCGDVFPLAGKLIDDTKATLLYHLPTVFPHANTFTLIHELADEYRRFDLHFLKSKIIFSNYVLKCEPGDPTTATITDNWGKIFALDGSIRSLVSIGDTIRDTECADAVNEATTLSSQKLTLLISKTEDIEKVRVQLGNEKCLKFTSDLTKLVKLEDVDMLFRADTSVPIKKCQDLLDLTDPGDSSNKPYADTKIIDLGSLDPSKVTELETKCSVELVDTSGSLGGFGGV